MENLYIIEGSSNSGKTTTINYLGNYSNISIFSEFMDHPKRPKSSTNLEEELENQKIFYEIERERMLKAREFINKIVFFDRSYLSILAVAYALEKLNKFKSYDHALNLYQSMIKEDWFIKPNKIYVLTSSFEEKLRRNNNRIKRLKSNWIKEEFEFYQNEFYEKIELEFIKIIIDTTGKYKEFAADYIVKELKRGDSYNKR